MATERRRAKVRQRRADWFKHRLPAIAALPERVVFIDETAVKTNLTRLRGRAKRGQRLTMLAGGRDLPHIYHNPDRLCLYLPGTVQWDASKRLDLTIIPWTHLWLIYFEEWIVSDDWKGGGKHPGEDDPDEGNRALRRSLRRMR